MSHGHRSACCSQLCPQFSSLAQGQQSNLLTTTIIRRAAVGGSPYRIRRPERMVLRLERPVASVHRGILEFQGSGTAPATIRETLDLTLAQHTIGYERTGRQRPTITGEVLLQPAVCRAGNNLSPRQPCRKLIDEIRRHAVKITLVCSWG